MRNASVRAARTVLLILALGCAWGRQKWTKPDLTHLSDAQAQQLLNDSPWAAPCSATIVTPKLEPREKDIPLPTPANQPKPGPSYATDGYGVDDGEWDGGVGKIRHGEPPKIPVLVRWDSALPVRAALLRTRDAVAHDTEHTLEKSETHYIIEVIGLIPARKAKPENDGSEPDASPSSDLNQLRNGVANATRLVREGKPPIAPDDVHFDEVSGLLQIYFPKTDQIVLQDKEVLFRTGFGTLQIVQRFRLKDMLYKGRLEL